MVGTVTESYFYDKAIGNPDYPNNVKVDWEEVTVERYSLTQAAKNSLGSVLTVFRVDDWGSEIEEFVEHPFFESDDTDDEVVESEIIEDLVSKALVMVQDKVDKLDPWQMQELVEDSYKQWPIMFRQVQKARMEASTS